MTSGVSGRSRVGGRTYRQVALDDWGILMCASAEGCKRKWAKTSHHNGRVDNAGTIHWERADVHPRRDGIYVFLKFVALVLHERDWRKLAHWERLYERCAFAIREARSRYHTTYKVTDTRADRQKVERAARRAGAWPGRVRRTNLHAYFWVRAVYTRGARAHHPKR